MVIFKYNFVWQIGSGFVYFHIVTSCSICKTVQVFSFTIHQYYAVGRRWWI